jgi:methionyl-tRNA formyltransferase
MLSAARHAAAAGRCSSATATALLLRLHNQHQHHSIGGHNNSGSRRRASSSSGAASAASPSSSSSPAAEQQQQHQRRILFLGTPDVAADVLNALLRASAEPGAAFRVVGVVTQPGKPRGRGNRAVPVPSPVEAAAAAARQAYDEAGGVASGLPPPPVVLTPPNARDAAFYEALAALGSNSGSEAGAAADAEATRAGGGGGGGDGGGGNAGATTTATTTTATEPTTTTTQTQRSATFDLAVTAAYGHILPQRFLDLPPLGTLNIHPSLLPKYRGAAPVPRALERGERDGALSLAYTVLRCDAGPVLAARRIPLTGDEQAPEVLARLFAEGADLLLENLPGVWAGGARARAREQDEAAATHAPKMQKEEGELAFGFLAAATLHNRVRAFSGWPGTSGSFLVAGANDNGSAGGGERALLKVVRTALPAEEDCARAAAAAAATSGGGGGGDSGASPSSPPPLCREVVFLDGGKRMLVPCGWEQGGSGGGSSTWLEVLELQPAGKKAMAPRDFKNGLGKGRRLLVEAGTGYRGPPGGPAASPSSPSFSS